MPDDPNCKKQSVPRSKNLIGIGFHSLSALLVIAFATNATAQTTAAAAPADKELTEIVVTGSLLHRTDIETESPVTVFTAEQIQQTGLTTIADVIRTVSADNSGTIPTAFGLGSWWLSR